MQRVQLDNTAPSSMRSGWVYYLNGANNDLGYEKEVTDAGMTEHKHYLSAGGMVFAMQVTRSGTLGTGPNAKPAENLQYLHHDHLGSVAVVTDADGSVTERLAYDPWGKRRFPNGTADKDDTIVGLTIDRGFTMHEHLDEMGLIHMNGRIFDPLIGRFMSADPFIQAPENLQSHNRFAYVMNNPLNHTDPSGYRSLWMRIRGAVIRVIAAVADGMGCGGYCSMAVNAYQGYKSGGIVGLALSFVPGFDNPYGNAALAAVKGCAAASANGGSCGRGAMAGLVRSQGGESVAGTLLAGCIAARINGSSCGGGALDAHISRAADHVVRDINKFYAQVRDGGYDLKSNFLPVVQGAVIACGASVVCGGFVAGAGAWGAKTLGDWLSNIYTANQAAKPAETNGKDAAGGEASKGGDRTRGLPPEGVRPPVDGELTSGPASRPSEQNKGGQSLWDDKGGEWRYFPENKHHNPHWDYNPHDRKSSPWKNVPIDGLPTEKK